MVFPIEHNELNALACVGKAVPHPLALGNIDHAVVLTVNQDAWNAPRASIETSRWETKNVELRIKNL